MSPVLSACVVAWAVALVLSGAVLLAVLVAQRATAVWTRLRGASRVNAGSSLGVGGTAAR